MKPVNRLSVGNDRRGSMSEYESDKRDEDAPKS